MLSSKSSDLHKHNLKREISLRPQQVRENLFSCVKIEKGGRCSEEWFYWKSVGRVWDNKAVTENAYPCPCAGKKYTGECTPWLATTFSFVIYFDCDNWVRRETIYFNRNSDMECEVWRRVGRDPPRACGQNFKDYLHLDELRRNRRWSHRISSYRVSVITKKLSYYLIK